MSSRKAVGPSRRRRIGSTPGEPCQVAVQVGPPVKPARPPSPERVPMSRHRSEQSPASQAKSAVWLARSARCGCFRRRRSAAAARHIALAPTTGPAARYIPARTAASRVRRPSTRRADRWTSTGSRDSLHHHSLSTWQAGHPAFQIATPTLQRCQHTTPHHLSNSSVRYPADREPDPRTAATMRAESTSGSGSAQLCCTRCWLACPAPPVGPWFRCFRRVVR